MRALVLWTEPDFVHDNDHALSPTGKRTRESLVHCTRQFENHQLPQYAEFRTPPHNVRCNFVAKVEAMLRGDVSFLARTLLFRACDLHRLVVAHADEDGTHRDGGLGLGPASVEAFLRDCEMLW